MQWTQRCLAGKIRLATGWDGITADACLGDPILYVFHRSCGAQSLAIGVTILGWVSLSLVWLAHFRTSQTAIKK